MIPLVADKFFNQFPRRWARSCTAASSRSIVAVALNVFFNRLKGAEGAAREASGLRHGRSLRPAPPSEIACTAIKLRKKDDEDFRKLPLSFVRALPPRGRLAAPAADWTDMFVGYRCCYHIHDPTIDHDIIKNVIQFATANRYFLGSNFLNVDVLMSNSYDPANGDPSSGAQEIYVTYRHQLSLNKAFKAGIKSGLIRDVSITAGGDLNTKNTAFAPGKKIFVVGPTDQLRTRRGLPRPRRLVLQGVDPQLLRRRRGRRTSSSTAPQWSTLTWGIPIALSKEVGSTFKGFGYATFPKGKDAVGVDTETEVLLRITWLFDVGSLVGVKKGSSTSAPGYEFWYHKFGNPTPIPVPGTPTKPNHTTSAPTFQAEIHF